MSIAKLIKVGKEGKTVLGKDVVIKKLHAGEIDTVYFAANCPVELKSKITELAEMSDAKTETLAESSEELGVELKKPFSILVVGLLNI